MARRGHGWWPYWLPMASFLLLTEFGGRLPEAWMPAVLVLRVLVPGGFFLYFAWSGRYPELRAWRPTAGGIALDVLVGLLGAALWVVPFLVAPSLRPEDLESESLHGFSLAVRFLGYAAVTPFVEELFVRSWMLRFADVFVDRKDFRNVPIAHFSWTSFTIVTLYFVFSHAPFEWGVMLGWTLMTMAWFYHRKHIAPLVLAHAVTNGAILLFVALTDGRITDVTGAVVDLWFLV